MKKRFIQILSVLCAAMLMTCAVAAWAEESPATPTDLAPGTAEESPAENSEEPVEEPGEEPPEETAEEIPEALLKSTENPKCADDPDYGYDFDHYFELWIQPDDNASEPVLVNTL